MERIPATPIEGFFDISGPTARFHSIEIEDYSDWETKESRRDPPSGIEPGVGAVSWLKVTWKRVFGVRDDAEPRRLPSLSISQIEHLESRLCLGSFPAAPLVEIWPSVPSEDVAPPADVFAEQHEPLWPGDVVGEGFTDGPGWPSGEYPTLPQHAEGCGYSTSTGSSAQLGIPPLLLEGDANSLLGPILPTADPRSGLLNDAVGSGSGQSATSAGAGSDGQSDADAGSLEFGRSPAFPGDSAPGVPGGLTPPARGRLTSAAGPVGLNVADAAGIHTQSGAFGAGSLLDAQHSGNQTLTTFGFYRNEGEAGAASAEAADGASVPPWWKGAAEPITIKYDFRDAGNFKNQMTDAQKARAVDALNAWSNATDGALIFVQDTAAPISEIINIGTGDLAAFGHVSGSDGTLGVGGGVLSKSTGESGDEFRLAGTAWLDVAETWDTTLGNGNPAGTFDYFTVVAHEVGHTLGLSDSPGRNSHNMMTGIYDVERSADSIRFAVDHGFFYAVAEDGSATDVHVSPMIAASNQLTSAEVDQLLQRATAATASQDAVIAIVDRGGTILGVRVEEGVRATVDANNNGMIDAGAESDLLAFMVEGAVAKARTAAFFSNGDPDNGTLAPLTSRLVRFVSQTTITQREVESRPTVDGAFPDTQRGPGLVAPIGLGGHFPPDIMHTPVVDLFAIEQTNRDHLDPTSIPTKNSDPTVTPVSPGDVLRFNISESDVNAAKVNALREPRSYGESSGLDADARSRGIATLPGGIPIFKDLVFGDGIGDTLVGGMGVFFPGPDGFATHEQGFVSGVGQTSRDRTNAPRILEAEYIALAAVGGSQSAARLGVPGAVIGDVAGIAPVPGVDLPFGRLDLVGVTLEVVGPIANKSGVGQVLLVGQHLGGGTVNGIVAPVDVGGDGVIGGGDDTLLRGGTFVPEGWIVPPRDGVGITAAEVQQIIQQGINAASVTRAAVRLPFGSRTRMVLAVSDRDGNIVGLFRMPDSTIFSIGVAVSKARNVNYYADAAKLQAADQVPGVPAGTAFTNRTFRFLSESRFPSGVDGSAPPVFSTLNNPFIDPRTAENIGAPQPAAAYTDTVLGRNSFNPSVLDRDSNFSDPTNLDNQNGVVFFPGSTPIYRADGTLIGGLGISGDGVDQDDVVSFIGAQGFLPPPTVTRADQIFVNQVRLPYIKFLRNPFG